MWNTTYFLFSEIDGIGFSFLWGGARVENGIISAQQKHVLTLPSRASCSCSEQQWWCELQCIYLVRFCSQDTLTRLLQSHSLYLWRWQAGIEVREGRADMKPCLDAVKCGLASWCPREDGVLLGKNFQQNAWTVHVVEKRSVKVEETKERAKTADVLQKSHTVNDLSFRWNGHRSLAWVRSQSCWYPYAGRQFSLREHGIKATLSTCATVF